MSAKARQRKARFEDLLSELEAIVGELERGEVGLDEALEKYEKGIAALRRCYEILRAAEKRVEILTKNPDGTYTAGPFEPEGKTAAKRKERKDAGAEPQGEDPGETLFDAGR